MSADYIRSFERDEREAHERDIQAMLDDPGDEPGEQDHPDFIDARKEVSPWDHDPPFDIDAEEPF